ncbi:hypothetical protein SCHPADRAFT_948346 [Schizopora paradoxa]|uniref:Uncharacterized protein n=1 Tax=Schizopora paradoxa TaxID=27342 RepID=A0A0H2QW22_9AGAM|nr:hypothetical protein SCHPADRAFT_948346 [Schizopora paradoxa]
MRDGGGDATPTTSTTRRRQQRRSPARDLYSQRLEGRMSVEYDQRRARTMTLASSPYIPSSSTADVTWKDMATELENSQTATATATQSLRSPALDTSRHCVTAWARLGLQNAHPLSSAEHGAPPGDLRTLNSENAISSGLAKQDRA